MKSGHLNIFSLLEFVAKHSQIPSKNIGNFKLYSKKISQLVSNIPKEQGWYLWGKFNENSKWKSIYLGKSGNLKTSSLKARIKEELSDERVVFWAFIYGKKQAFKNQHKLYYGKYDKGAKRSLKKFGTNFIIWVSDKTTNENDIISEEKKLISYYKPTSNIQRTKSEPSLKTKIIIKTISKEIRKIIKT